MAMGFEVGGGGPAILATVCVYIGTPGVLYGTPGLLYRPPVGGCMGTAEGGVLVGAAPKCDGGGTPGAI